jgi:hypothetical protein
LLGKEVYGEIVANKKNILIKNDINKNENLASQMV